MIKSYAQNNYRIVLLGSLILLKILHITGGMVQQWNTSLKLRMNITHFQFCKYTSRTIKHITSFGDNIKSLHGRALNVSPGSVSGLLDCPWIVCSSILMLIDLFSLPLFHQGGVSQKLLNRRVGERENSEEGRRKPYQRAFALSFPKLS